jgi:hypothetical protein
MKSLLNPFSVLRHLDFWSVVAFDTGGDAGGGGGSGSGTIGMAPAPDMGRGGGGGSGGSMAVAPVAADQTISASYQKAAGDL